MQSYKSKGQTEVFFFFEEYGGVFSIARMEYSITKEEKAKNDE